MNRRILHRSYAFWLKLINLKKQVPKNRNYNLNKERGWIQKSAE